MRLLLLLLILGFAIAVVVTRRRSRRIIVLGTQTAEANARERLHRERFPHLTSPLPELRYDPSRGETTLIDPQLCDLDRELRSICSRVGASTANERRDFRNAATNEDFYTLLEFARRASVFALRDQDRKWIEDALTAVGMVDAARVDERDLPLTLSLIHHAAEGLAVRPLEMFDAAAALGEPRTSDIIRSFVRQSTADKDIESSWGYRQIDGPNGAGFVEYDFQPYKPTGDLLGVALAIRQALKHDRYEADVTLATELPSIWFPKAVREQAERILADGVAAASLHGTLRSSEHRRADAQMFLVFVVEMSTDGDAATLETLAGSSGIANAVVLPVHDGQFFALAIARSTEVGVSSYETNESIRRFEGPLRAALQAAAY